MKKIGKREYGISYLLGIIISCCLATGYQMELNEEWNPFQMVFWLEIVIGTLVIGTLTAFLYSQLRCHSLESKESGSRAETGFCFKSWQIFILLLVCYLPIFLGVFPGFFVYDAQEEYIQVVTRQFTTHHPIFHVLLMGGLVQTGYKLFHSYNAGIALYSLFQMIVMAGGFTYILMRLKSLGMTKRFRIVSFLFFGCFPTIVMFVLCSAKDGLFSMALTILLFSLFDLCRDPEQFYQNRTGKIILVLSGVCMMLLRHNGMYAFLVFVPVLLIYLKNFRKKTLVYICFIFFVYLLVERGLIGITGAESGARDEAGNLSTAGEYQEFLTVPIQQLARVYAYDQSSITASDQELLIEFLPESVLKRYTPKVSDSVKIDFNNEYFSEHKKDFFALWFRVGTKNPLAYANAWLMTSYGYWYPAASIDGYRGNTVFTYTYGESSYFGYEVEQPGERNSHIPFIDELYQKLSLNIEYWDIPVLGLLFCPGFLCFVMLFTLGYQLAEKRYSVLLPMILIFLVWLTVLLGPICLVRYVLFLWFLLPGFLLSLFVK